MHRAIETRYSGYRFRSRLEARYAVLFDSLGIAWDYEPEGFELGGGKRYLPDFWLHIPDKPGHGYWVEIKALAPTRDEIDRLARVKDQTGHQAWFMLGTPGGLDRALAVDLSKYSSLRWSAPLVACAPAPVTPQRFDAAVMAARSARFEFGEHGAPA